MLFCDKCPQQPARVFRNFTVLQFAGLNLLVVFLFVVAFLHSGSSGLRLFLPFFSIPRFRFSGSAGSPAVQTLFLTAVSFAALSLLLLLSLAVLAASAGIGVGLYRKREF